MASTVEAAYSHYYLFIDCKTFTIIILYKTKVGGRCLLGREVYTLTIETLPCKHAIFIAYDAGAQLALAQN